jgi:hypothetical protein
VSGFEKYSFRFAFEVLSDGDTVGVFNKNIVETGKNFEQIRGKVMGQLADNMAESFINYLY